jgi:hypothetical protein
MPGAVDYLELLAGKGDRMITIAPGPVVDISGSRVIGIRTRVRLFDDTWLAAGLASHTPAHWPGRIAFSASVETRR